MKRELVEAVSGMREDEALRLTREMLERGEDPIGIMEACREAAGIVSDRYDSDEYFLPELVMSAEILRKISEIFETSLITGLVSGASNDDLLKLEQAITWLRSASELKQLSWLGKRNSSRVPDVFTRAFESNK